MKKAGIKLDASKLMEKLKSDLDEITFTDNQGKKITIKKRSIPANSITGDFGEGGV